jgi:hypothetical protein
MRDDRDVVMIAVRCVALAGVVLLAAVPVYLYLEPPWRGIVPRLAAALVLGITLLEIRAILVLRLAHHEASPLDAARIPPVTDDGAPHRLREIEAGVRAALRSRRHFERVLWPRLAALSPRPLVPPPTRRGRGPSLAGLRALIATIEHER